MKRCTGTKIAGAACNASQPTPTPRVLLGAANERAATHPTLALFFYADTSDALHGTLSCQVSWKLPSGLWSRSTSVSKSQLSSRRMPQTRPRWNLEGEGALCTAGSRVPFCFVATVRQLAAGYLFALQLLLESKTCDQFPRSVVVIPLMDMPLGLHHWQRPPVTAGANGRCGVVGNRAHIQQVYQQIFIIVARNGGGLVNIVLSRVCVDGVEMLTRKVYWRWTNTRSVVAQRGY
jgi:hypothetical protein